jgi:hypothetical protein
VLPEYALRLLQNKFVLTKILLQLLIFDVVYKSKSAKNCEVLITFSVFVCKLVLFTISLHVIFPETFNVEVDIVPVLVIVFDKIVVAVKLLVLTDSTVLLVLFVNPK